MAYSNPYFNTDFDSYNESRKWVNEQSFANQQAWDARLYGTWEREQTQEWNLEMWNRQNEWNLEQWQREQDYNSIASQIERARSAGVSAAAVAGGDYKSAQTDAPQSSSAPYASPQSPVKADTPSTNAMQRLGQNAATLVDATKNFTDNILSEKQVSLNARQIDSNVKVNSAQISELLSRSGLQDVNAGVARKSISWIDNLNYVTVQEKLANINSAITDTYVSIQQMLQGWGKLEIEQQVADTNTLVANQNVEESKARTAGILKDNEYKEKYHLSQTEALELNNVILRLKAGISKETGLPLGMQEFEFNYAMARQGLLKPYIDYCVIPSARAKMTPNELKVDNVMRNEAQLGPIKAGLNNVVTEYSPIFPYGYLSDPNRSQHVNPF